MMGFNTSCTAHVAPQFYETTRVSLQMLLPSDPSTGCACALFPSGPGAVELLPVYPHVSAPRLTFIYATYNITGFPPQ